jgi:isopentenyl diphosphate isomerase/L-lactate dehydrogenase-like FMN-dependent dehydrogenase
MKVKTKKKYKIMIIQAHDDCTLHNYIEKHKFVLLVHNMMKSVENTT